MLLIFLIHRSRILRNQSLSPISFTRLLIFSFPLFCHLDTKRSRVPCRWNFPWGLFSQMALFNHTMSFRLFFRSFELPVAARVRPVDLGRSAVTLCIPYVCLVGLQSLSFYSRRIIHHVVSQQKVIVVLLVNISG